MIKLEISFRFASPLAFHYLYPILTHTHTHISETDEIRQTFIPGRWIVDRRFPGIGAEERQA